MLRNNASNVAQARSPRGRLIFGVFVAAVFLLTGCVDASSAWWRDEPWWAKNNPAGASRSYRFSSRAQSVPLGQRKQAGAYTVRVQRGDTVYSLARRNGVPVRSMIDANRLSPPYRIKPGQKLTVPASQVHVVRRGDTMYSISRRYDVDTTTLARQNRIRSPYTISVGQRLQVPGRGTRAATQVASRGGAAPARQPRSKPTLPKPPRREGNFSWPVEGKVISRFGGKANGLHNDGINIAVPKGTPIRAAQSGVIAYSGNELKGYGNLLLVRHSGGWVTAYAHNSKLLVKRGETVRKGQVISHAGNTGGVGRPQLHFELRKGKKAVNPSKYL